MVRDLGSGSHCDLWCEAFTGCSSWAGGNEVGRQATLLMVLVHVSSLISWTITWSLL